MWKQPWGYKEGVVICFGLFLTGIILQFTVGKVDWDLLAFPINIIILALLVCGIVVMHLLSRRVYLFRWMSRYPAAVTSLVAVVIITVVMGLIRQKPFHTQVESFERWLGFSQMLSAWPFILLYGWLLAVLGLVILRRFLPLRWGNVRFLLNHLGLFIAMTGAVFGSADMQRLKMTTTIASPPKPEWRAFDEQGAMKELPLAVELQNFTIDEYPPKLMLIDNETGAALPKGNPANILLEDSTKEGKLQDWRITVEQRIPEAASMATADTVRFVEFRSMGAAYAVYVKAANAKRGLQKEGWVSCGSFMFPYKALRLTDEASLIMPEREPRRFASEVIIFTEDGKTLERTIEVNKPAVVNGWKIYQLSYDESKGKWSTISIFELVRDPWLPVVYAGIWMLIAGAVCMFVTAGKKNKKKEEDAV